MNTVTESALSFDLAAKHLLTKSNIQSFADKFIESVNEGYGNPLETAAIINGLESALKLIKDGIRPMVLNNLKEGGKGIFNGVKIETMESGGKSDYNTCQCPVWVRLSKELKDQETLLKALPITGKTLLDESTGETYTAYPPIKPATTTTYKVTIPAK